MAWFRKEKTPKVPLQNKHVRMPEGLWTKCENCSQIVYKKEILRNHKVCPKCNYHFRISARERLEAMFDDGDFEILDSGIRPTDPLEFIDTKPYKERLQHYQKRTGLQDAIINARGWLDGYEVIICAMEFSISGGK